MVIVDSALSTGVATNAGDISANAGKITDLVIVDSALSTGVAANEGAISDNKGDIANLVIVDSALSTNVDLNATEIVTLKGVDSALSASIAALTHEMVEEVADFRELNTFGITTPFLDDVLVFVNGVKIDSRDYTLNPADSIVFTGVSYPLDINDEVIAYGRI